jgi:soluble lytic murein transglycosylase-like protein
MTDAPILRSAALQRALALNPRRPTTAAAATSFADTLSQAQSQAPSQAQAQPRASAGSAQTRASTAAAWASASRLTTASAAGAASAASVGSGPVPYADLIASAAKRHGVDPALLAALVKQESNFNPAAKSGAGARGLTQLMDATARGLGVTDSFDPAQALEGGAKFLGGLLKQFKGDERLALAAYNAGPGAVQKYGGIPPYEETQRYVPKVLGYYEQYRRAGIFPNSA